MKKVFYLFLIALLFSCTVSLDGEVEAASTNATRAEVIVEIGKLLKLDGTQRATQFKDVPKSHSASGYIQSAVDLGIVSGYKDGTFKPNAALTRGHFAVFISRAFEQELPSGEGTFRDVSSKSSYATAIKQLVSAGIASGYEDGRFKPDNVLTKRHLSLFMKRTANYLKQRK